MITSFLKLLFDLDQILIYDVRIIDEVTHESQLFFIIHWPFVKPVLDNHGRLKGLNGFIQVGGLSFMLLILYYQLKYLLTK